MKIHFARLVVDSNTILGEGPIWDWKRQLLFWVDIEGKQLLQFNPVSRKKNAWHLSEMIGSAVPTTTGRILMALESGLSLFDLKESKSSFLGILENNGPNMRYNDGKVSPNGDFWIGSMHKEFVPKTGNLYSITQHYEKSVQIQNTTISNGMAWSADQKTFYFIDSPSFEVKSYDYNSKTGAISNPRTAFKIPESYGAPDGMSIDAEDTLWVAHWGGGCVRRWNPTTGEVLQKVEVPAPHVTSCCFGGKNLDTLYITSAKSGMSEEQIKKYPLSGGLFTFNPQVSGTPITYFKEKCHIQE